MPVRRDEPERRLSPREVEAVLGRAIELHVRSAAAGPGDELAETELLRIGGELGLEPTVLRQALAEVDSGLVEERDSLARHLGERRAASSRIVPRGAADVHRELEAYLLETECMVVERRLPGRTVYASGKGVVAWGLRAARRAAGRHPLLEAERLEVGVQPLDARSCCVAVAVDLERTRRDHALGGAAGGAVTGGATAGLLGTVVAPPLALVGLPVAVGVFLATRAAYHSTVRSAQARLESLLDRLEHRELRRSPARVRLLGF